MGNLVPLGPPLAPLEMSIPDWTHLEAAIDTHPEPWQGSQTDLKAADEAELDENTRKVRQDEIFQSIARLDRLLRRIGSADDRIALQNITHQLEGILHRIPRKSS
jgi:hypothetical protein